MTNYRAIRFTLLCLCLSLTLLVLSGCGGRSFIEINYQLTAAPKFIDGRQIHVRFTDRRADKVIFGPQARKHFRYFTGIFDLRMVQPEQQDVFVGRLDLETLFIETFKKRLEIMGAQTVKTTSPDTLVFEIALDTFYLELNELKWQTKLSYETRLIRDEKVLARQTAQGSAERLKLIGSRDADKLISDMFTDIVNQTDIQRLIDNAGL